MVAASVWFPVLKLFVSNRNFLSPPGVSPAAIGLSHFGEKQRVDPDQHCRLATVDLVMSGVKFKKGKLKEICLYVIVLIIVFSFKILNPKLK